MWKRVGILYNIEVFLITDDLLPDTCSLNEELCMSLWLTAHTHTIVCYIVVFLCELPVALSWFRRLLQFHIGALILCVEFKNMFCYLGKHLMWLYMLCTTPYCCTVSVQKKRGFYLYILLVALTAAWITQFSCQLSVLALITLELTLLKKDVCEIHRKSS